MRDVSPFWFNAAGVDQIVVDPNARRRADRGVPRQGQGRRRRTSCRRSSTRCRPAGWRPCSPIPTSRAPARRRHRRVRRRRRLRRHRHRLRAVRVRRRSRHVGGDPTELGRVHHRTRRPPPRRRTNPDRQHPAGVRRRPDGRQRLLGVRLRRASPRTSTTIRIMAYDFSVEEAGPIAPLAWVESAITGAHRSDRVARTSWCSGCRRTAATGRRSCRGECPADSSRVARA